jgi:hypothetical protein
MLRISPEAISTSQNSEQSVFSISTLKLAGLQRKVPTECKGIGPHTVKW